MEISIPGVYLADAMFAHEHGCVDIVQDAAFQMWNFRDDLGERFSMSRGGQQNVATPAFK